MEHHCFTDMPPIYIKWTIDAIMCNMILHENDPMPKPKRDSEQHGFADIETPQDLLRSVKANAAPKQNGFMQLSEGEMARLRKLTRINPIAAQIFLFLMERMNHNNAVACSQTLLAQITERSRTTVHRAIVVLKEHNFIDVKKMGGTQVFHLNAGIVWHSYEGRTKYVELVAPILLDMEENPELKKGEMEAGATSVLIMEETETDI